MRIRDLWFIAVLVALIGTGLVAQVPTSSLMTFGGATLGGNTFTGPQLLPDGTTAAPSIAFSSEPGTGFFWFSAGRIGVTAAGTTIGYFRTKANGGFQSDAFTGQNDSQGFNLDSAAGIKTGSAHGYCISSTTSSGGGSDTGVARDSAGVLDIGTCAQGDSSGTAKLTAMLVNATAFASLGTPTNGTLRFCNDCTIANPCAGSGTGALAKRLNGAWVCN